MDEPGQELHDSRKNLVNGTHNVAVAFLYLDLILVPGRIVQLHMSQEQQD